MEELYNKIRTFLGVGHEMDDEHNPVSPIANIQKAGNKYANKHGNKYANKHGNKHSRQHHYNTLQLGGACSLCGADGVTKATCPLNESAKNKKYELHNKTSKSIGMAPVPKKTSPVRSYVPPPTKRSPEVLPQRIYKKVDTRGCVKQNDQKYMKRPSPPYPANQCCDEIMQGNDGNMYQSRADRNGTCRWYKVKSS
jgi:hypothetical protein